MPSALDAAVRALETRLAQAFPTTPIAWPNVEFTAPAGTLWLRPWVLWGLGELLTMRADQMNRVLGLYQVTVFSPLGRGAGPAVALGDQVRDVYNRASFAQVRVRAPSGPVALPVEPPWYSVAVSVPFYVLEPFGA